MLIYYRLKKVTILYNQKIEPCVGILFIKTSGYAVFSPLVFSFQLCKSHQAL